MIHYIWLRSAAAVQMHIAQQTKCLLTLLVCVSNASVTRVLSPPTAPPATAPHPAQLSSAQVSFYREKAGSGERQDRQTAGRQLTVPPSPAPLCSLSTCHWLPAQFSEQHVRVGSWQHLWWRLPAGSRRVHSAQGEHSPLCCVSSLLWSLQAVRTRVKALKKLQFATIKAETEYYREVHALDIKYQKQYDEINAKRTEVIRWEFEVSSWLY